MIALTPNLHTRISIYLYNMGKISIFQEMFTILFEKCPDTFLKSAPNVVVFAIMY